MSFKFANKSFTFLILALLFVSTEVVAVPLRVMTYNAAFLPMVSKRYGERKDLFAKNVAFTKADVVALQEVWMPALRRKLIKDFKAAGYPHSAWVKSGSFFPRGAIGHGLLIVSKYPFVGEPKFFRFRQYTRGEEYFARKGVLKATIELPNGTELTLFDTHLGAIAFSRKLNDFVEKELDIQEGQLEQLAEIVFQNQDQSQPFLVLGDFNFHPTQWLKNESFYSSTQFRSAYTKFLNLLAVEDVFPRETASQHPERWITWDPARNPIIREISKTKIESANPPSRFDYIWYGSESGLILRNALVAMDDRFGKISSDHFALIADFEVPGSPSID